jgi:hypothetical protein
MEPVRTAWQNEEFRSMSSSFNGFCELLGLEKVGPYMQSKQAAGIEDWSAVPLDTVGKDIQGELARRFQVCTPRDFVYMLFSYLKTATSFARNQDFARCLHRKAQANRCCI